jgi:hypothetical protein
LTLYCSATSNEGSVIRKKTMATIRLRMDIVSLIKFL